MIQSPPSNALPDGARVRYAPEPAAHNVAAFASVVCAVLWPLAVGIPALVTALTGNASEPLFVASFLVPLVVAFSPVAGIVTGAIGLRRAQRHARLRGSRWLAIAGLALGCLWFVGIFLISDAGPTLVNWLTHL